jgi:hypothetical protein
MFRRCFKGLPTGKIAPGRSEERRPGCEGVFRWANLRGEPRNISFLWGSPMRTIGRSARAKSEGWSEAKSRAITR